MYYMWYSVIDTFTLQFVITVQSLSILTVQGKHNKYQFMYKSSANLNHKNWFRVVKNAKSIFGVCHWFLRNNISKLAIWRLYDWSNLKTCVICVSNTKCLSLSGFLQMKWCCNYIHYVLIISIYPINAVIWYMFVQW